MLSLRVSMLLVAARRGVGLLRLESWAAALRVQVALVVREPAWQEYRRPGMDRALSVGGRLRSGGASASVLSAVGQFCKRYGSLVDVGMRVLYSVVPHL